MTPDHPLDGTIVFLLEDDPIIGLDLLMLLEDAGATIRGPFASVKAGFAAIETFEERIAQCAVLDYELGKETCDEVAIRLAALSVPIVFHTGSSEDVMGLAMRLDAAVVRKPSQADQLVTAIVKSLSVRDPHRSDAL